VLELATSTIPVVGVFADPATLDAVDAYRIAPDEAMVVGEPGAAPSVAIDDPAAVVLDVTDGWTVVTLTGDRVRDAFAQLSALRLPDDGFVQGDVARVPARVLVEHERLRILVPAMWADQLRSRILARCQNLGIREAST